MADNLSQTVAQVLLVAQDAQIRAELKSYTIETLIKGQITDALELLVNIQQTSLPGADKAQRCRDFCERFNLDAYIMRKLL